jgi:hypothetical protein
LGFNRSSAETFIELNNFVSSESGFMKANCYMSVNKSRVTSNFKDIDFAILDHICHFTDLFLRLITLERAFPCTIMPKEITVDKSKLRFSFSIEFADKSHVSFNYSAIPDFLEGMKEEIEISKGNLNSKLTNFQELYIELSGNKINKKTLFREHGHKTSIEEAFVSTIDNTGSGESLEHIEATSKLYLKIIEAMNINNSATLFI